MAIDDSGGIAASTLKFQRIMIKLCRQEVSCVFRRKHRNIRVRCCFTFSRMLAEVAIIACVIGVGSSLLIMRGRIISPPPPRHEPPSSIMSVPALPTLQR